MKAILPRFPTRWIFAPFFFFREDQIMRIFVPGRICLFGEHSDWAGGHRRTNPELEKGYCLVAGTDQGIYADVKPHPNKLILKSTSIDGTAIGPYEIPMEPKYLLEEARLGHLWSYQAGVAYRIATTYPVRGLIIENYKTDLPMKKGLSSSAAICVLTARAFNIVYSLGLPTMTEMELAYQGELTASSLCGRMDQACAFGNHPLLMAFDGDRFEVQELKVGKDFHFVIVDFKAKKDTIKILNRLNQCYPFARNELDRNVQNLFGPISKSITLKAIKAIESGSDEQLGVLMNEAQRSFDCYAIPACPEELEAPILHKVLGHDALKPYLYGGKGVGSQGDGSAQLLARSRVAQDAIVQIIEHDLDMTCMTLTLRSV
jgi:galactokinase